MMAIEKIKDILKRTLTKKRYEHSIGVQKTAIKLAEIYDASVEKASIAGLIHDCAKNLSHDALLNYVKQFDILMDSVSKHQKQLLHGAVGAKLAEVEFGIKDEEIINAIKFHTTGRKNMSLLEKIIYLADYIEPNRSFAGIDEIRELAMKDLDRAVLMALNNSINYIISKEQLLHPDTIFARNYLLLCI